MQKEKNFQNSNTNINFMWLYPLERPIATQKIVNGEEISITDIIPNNEEMVKYKYQSKEERLLKVNFFLQNVVSWAINFPNNTVRIVRHPIYSYILTEEDIEQVSEIEDFEKRRVKIRELCEKNLKERFNTTMTLKEIEEKYDECFENFEKDMHKRGYKNFSIVKFENLVNKHLTKDEIEEDIFLKFLIKEDSLLTKHTNPDLGISIDAMRISLNYHGFGYEKNLTIDMDNTAKNLKEWDYEKKSFGNFGNTELSEETINNPNNDIKFPLRLKEESKYYENSLLYTKNIKHEKLSKIKKDCEYLYTIGFYKKIYADQKDLKENLWKYVGGGIYEPTKYLIKEEIGTESSYLLDLSKENNKKNNDMIFGYYETVDDVRSFSQETTSKSKKNLPIVYEKHFWPQDDLYNETKFEKDQNGNFLNEFKKIDRKFFETFEDSQDYKKEVLDRIYSNYRDFSFNNS